AAISGMEYLAIEIDRPPIENVCEIDRGHVGITWRGHASPMQTAVHGVVIDRSVAGRPTMERVEKENVGNAAEVVVLDPGLPAVGGMKECVAAGPTMQRVDKGDASHLAIDRDNGPAVSGIGGVGEFAEVIEKSRRSD